MLEWGAASSSGGFPNQGSSRRRLHAGGFVTSEPVFSLECLVGFTREAVEAWSPTSAMSVSVYHVSLTDTGLSSLFSLE